MSAPLVLSTGSDDYSQIMETQNEESKSDLISVNTDRFNAQPVKTEQIPITKKGAPSAEKARKQLERPKEVKLMEDRAKQRKEKRDLLKQ